MHASVSTYIHLLIRYVTFSCKIKVSRYLLAILCRLFLFRSCCDVCSRPNHHVTSVAVPFLRTTIAIERILITAIITVHHQATAAADADVATQSQDHFVPVYTARSDIVSTVLK